MSNEADTKDSDVIFDRMNLRGVPKVFVLCDQRDTAPVYGYLLRQQGMIVILETSRDKAVERWSSEIPDLVVIDVDTSQRDRIELYRKFRGITAVPILLFLPSHHETQILEAYSVGVDEVVVKPVSPPIFLAKILAWIRRSSTNSAYGLNVVGTGKYRLDPVHRCLIDPNNLDIKMTDLEFRLLQILMSRPAHLFKVEDLVQSIWGEYRDNDQILLKNVVYRVRKKIEKDPRNPILLQTCKGGYSFQA